MTKKEFEYRNLSTILPGMAICVLGNNMFLSPNNIVVGGIIGLGKLINHWLNWPIQITCICLEIPLFIVSVRAFGLKFCLRSLLIGSSLVFLSEIIPIKHLFTDIWMSALFGGLMIGTGLGLILGSNATTGGIDMLAKCVNRLLPRIQVSLGIFIINVFVAIITSFCSEKNECLPAIFCTFIISLVMFPMLNDN